MPRSSRDSQRQKVYDGEPASGGRRFESLAEIERYLRHVLSLKIVQRRFGDYACGGSIAVLGGGISRASYHAGRREPFADPRRKGLSSATIVFPRFAWNEHIALHELAHHLTRSADEAHGWEFAEALLWLTRNRIGAEHAARLREGWRSSGARYTPPRKRRAMTPEQKAAARARLAEIRERQEEQRAAERGEWVIERVDAEAYGPTISSRSEFCWGEIGGAGELRQIRYWSTWPKGATIYTLRSSAEKWAERERQLCRLPDPASPFEIRVVSLAEALEHYEAMIDRTAEHHRKLQAAAEEARDRAAERLAAASLVDGEPSFAAGLR